MNFSCWNGDNDNGGNPESSLTTTDKPLLLLHSWATPCQPFCHGNQYKTHVGWTDVE
jgi:hypothetical protein